MTIFLVMLIILNAKTNIFRYKPLKEIRGKINILTAEKERGNGKE